MVEYDRSRQTTTAEPLRICVAGIGGAGSNVLDSISIERSAETKLVSFQTDVRVLNRCSSPHKVQMGTELMRGIGSGGDPDLGREAAIFSREEIRSTLEGHDMVFICTGLGGGTGSGASPVIAEIAKTLGAIVVVFATVPFSFEGRRRQQQSREALDRLEKCADALILFDNNRMGELVLPKDGIQKAFAQGDQLIAQSIRGVTAMVGAPGLVKLGLADLVSALRVSEGRCLFGFGEAKGQNRGSEALKRALKSPLINQGELLQNAKNLLVHVVGGESLTLNEVEAVMKQLGRHVPDETQILFGIGIDPKLGETITISLVSALSAHMLATARPPAVEEAPAAPPPVLKAVRQPGIQAKAAAPVAAAPAPAPVAPPPVAATPVSMDDLFGSEIPATAPIETEPEPAPPVAKAPEPAPRRAAPAPVVEKAPEPAPAPVARKVEPVRQIASPPPLPVAPPPPPAPEPEPEMVYQAEEEESYDFEEPVVAHEPEPEIEPEPSPAPVRESTRVRLMSVIGGAKPAPQPAPVEDYSPPVDEIQFEQESAPPPIVAPTPETAPIPLTRTSTTVVRPATNGTSVVVARTNEPAPPPPEPIQDTTRRSPTPAEQQTLKLAGEDRGRFKDTEPSFGAQTNEDLDTPTWMRMRKRLVK